MNKKIQKTTNNAERKSVQTRSRGLDETKQTRLNEIIRKETAHKIEICKEEKTIQYIEEKAKSTREGRRSIRNKNQYKNHETKENRNKSRKILERLRLVFSSSYQNLI